MAFPFESGEFNRNASHLVRLDARVSSAGGWLPDDLKNPMHKQKNLIDDRKKLARDRNHLMHGRKNLIDEVKNLMRDRKNHTRKQNHRMREVKTVMHDRNLLVVGV